MSVLTKSIQETFRDIVSLTGTNVLAEVNTLLTAADATVTGKEYDLSEINFVYGHASEVTDMLSSIANDPTEREKQFPLIWVEEDIRVTHRDNFDHALIKRIIIAWQTDPTYESQKREIHSFVPCLRPIYKEFIRQVARSKRFWIYDQRTDMPHEAIDRKYWGTAEDGTAKSVFNNYIDAIEINGLDLKLTPNNCN